MIREMIRSTWHTVSLLPTSIAIVVLLSIAAIIYIKTRHRVSEHFARRFALLILCTGIIDWALLAALPKLGLSFGPIGPPLLGITVVRSVIVWGLYRLWHLFIQRNGQLSEMAQYRLMAVALVLMVLVTVCEVNGLYIEPFNLSVTRLTLPDDASSTKSSIRIVQLSDLHIERITKRERAVVEQVVALKPDIIVLTADFLNTSYTYDAQTHADTHWLLSQLGAPYGI